MGTMEMTDAGRSPPRAFGEPGRLLPFTRSIIHLGKCWWAIIVTGETEVPTSLEHKIIMLIKELRNYRNPHTNWSTFKALVEENIDYITCNFSTRWIISICDTYIDYGEGQQARHAMSISIFMNMLRLGETIKFVRPEIDQNRVEQTSHRVVRFENGLNTFAIHRQDTFLNLTRRFTSLMQDDEVMLSIWKELLKRIHLSENVITDFSRTSQVSDRYFPIKNLGIKDNYGL